MITLMMMFAIVIMRTISVMVILLTMMLSQSFAGCIMPTLRRGVSH